MQIQRSSDCGNSPKNRFAEDAAIALLCADAAKMLVILAADCRCEIVGAGGSQDCSGFPDDAFGNAAIRSIAVISVVTHGRAGAVEGTVTLESGTARGFCLVMRFTSAKADQIGEARLYAPAQS
jgi:hypothetical protein